ncbi:MAG: hypothetical protein ABH877_04020 [bacterium]
MQVWRGGKISADSVLSTGEADMGATRDNHLCVVTTTVAALLLAVAAVAATACGDQSVSSTSASVSSTSPTAPASSTTTRPTCSASRLDLGLFPQLGLTADVERTRAAIFDAARSCDYAGLERLALAGAADFTFTFGGASDGPGAYWRSAEEAGDPVLATLITILDMPYGRLDGMFVWPFAHALDFQALTADLVELLGQYFPEKEIVDWKAFGGYAGYRLGISETGEWVFFVAGD